MKGGGGGGGDMHVVVNWEQPIYTSWTWLTLTYVTTLNLFIYLPQKYKHTSTHQRIYNKVVWGIEKPERFIYPHSNPIVL